MKYKSYIKYFLIFSIILISLLPTYNFYQYAKKYDFKKSFNLDYVEKYVNYTIYKLFNRSMVQNKVISGKDDFLFLGNDYANVLHKTNGTYPISEEIISHWSNNLKELQEFYESQGIKFLFVIAPNKHTVYREKLPDWMYYNNEENLTDIMIKSAQSNGVKILYLKDILLKNKDEINTLYYKWDTHWNEYGASFGYQAIVDKLNNLYNLNIKKEEFNINKTMRNGGDLANFLKIGDLLNKNDNEYILHLKNNQEICHGNINIESGLLENCQIKNNFNFQINTQPQYTIVKNKKEKVLFMCDSFGTGHTKLFNLTFNEVYKWHYKHLVGNKLNDFIDKNKPDIVIYQLIERGLFDEQIFKINKDILLVKESLNQKSTIFDLEKERNNFIKNENLKLNFMNGYISFESFNSDNAIIILNPIQVKTGYNFLSMEIESSTDTFFQVYYKEHDSDDYTENKSYKISLKKGLNSFTLKMSSEYIKNSLRIDLVSDKGQYKITQFKIFANE